MTPADVESCMNARCDRVGLMSFASHPDDMRCAEHHATEERRRIAALDAAAGLFKALVG